jgi:hypothetical protein
MDYCTYLAPPYNLGLSYIFVAVSTHLLLKSFTFMSMCGMNQDLTSVRILLSLSPPITPIRALALSTQTVPTAHFIVIDPQDGNRRARRIPGHPRS